MWKIVVVLHFCGCVAFSIKVLNSAILCAVLCKKCGYQNVHCNTIIMQIYRQPTVHNIFYIEQWGSAHRDPEILFIAVYFWLCFFLLVDPPPQPSTPAESFENGMIAWNKIDGKQLYSLWDRAVVALWSCIQDQSLTLLDDLTFID